MAACNCAGEMCNCEAIQVPPKLSFWKKYDRSVHGFVAWMAVLNMAMLAALPMTMYAQEAGSTPPPQQTAPGPEQSPPPLGQPPMMQPPPEGFKPPEDEQRGPMGGQQGQGMRQEGPKCDLARIKGQVTMGLKQYNRIKARVALLEKRGVKVPAEMSAALAKVDELMAKIQSVKDCEEIVDLEIGEAMQDVSEAIHENLGTMERLANLKNIYARLDRQLKAFDRQLASDKALAAKSKTDVSAAVKNFEDELNALKAAYAEAKSKIDAGEDLEAAFEQLQDGVFDKMENVAMAHAAIQQLLRLSTTTAAITREITNNQRTLDRLKKAGKDTSEAQSILDEAKAKFSELKAAAAAQPVDMTALSDLLDELADLRGSFTDELNALRGIQEKDEIDQGLNIPSFQTPKLDFGM